VVPATEIRIQSILDVRVFELMVITNVNATKTTTARRMHDVSTCHTYTDVNATMATKMPRRKTNYPEAFVCLTTAAMSTSARSTQLV
jgi:hypothetical protein